MYKFSNRSNAVLGTVDVRLQELMARAIKVSPIDFGIPSTGGKRTAQEQNRLFLNGASKADGFKKLSKHQSGLAVDVYAWVNGRASWDAEHLAIIAGVVLAVANQMDLKIRWGGTFGKQGKEFKGWDDEHYEIIED